MIILIITTFQENSRDKEIIDDLAKANTHMMKKVWHPFHFFILFHTFNFCRFCAISTYLIVISCSHSTVSAIKKESQDIAYIYSPREKKLSIWKLFFVGTVKKNSKFQNIEKFPFLHHRTWLDFCKISGRKVSLFLNTIWNHLLQPLHHSQQCQSIWY